MTYKSLSELHRLLILVEIDYTCRPYHDRLYIHRCSPPCCLACVSSYTHDCNCRCRCFPHEPNDIDPCSIFEVQANCSLNNASDVNNRRDLACRRSVAESESGRSQVIAVYAVHVAQPWCHSIMNRVVLTIQEIGPLFAFLGDPALRARPVGSFRYMNIMRRTSNRRRLFRLTTQLIVLKFHF